MALRTERKGTFLAQRLRIEASSVSYNFLTQHTGMRLRTQVGVRQHTWNTFRREVIRVTRD